MKCVIRITIFPPGRLAVGPQRHGGGVYNPHVKTKLFVRCHGRGKLRTATKARTVARAFRCGRAHVERAAFSSSLLRRADGPAIDTRGRNAHEKQTVKPPIAPENRPVANVSIQHNGRILSYAEADTSGFRTSIATAVSVKSDFDPRGRTPEQDLFPCPIPASAAGTRYVTASSGSGSRESGRIGDPASSSFNQTRSSVGIAMDSESTGVGNRDLRNLVVRKFGERFVISCGECVERIRPGALRGFTPSCACLVTTYPKPRSTSTCLGVATRHHCVGPPIFAPHAGVPNTLPRKQLC